MDFAERYADFVQKLGLFLGIDLGSLFSCFGFFFGRLVLLPPVALSIMIHLKSVELCLLAHKSNLFSLQTLLVESEKIMLNCVLFQFRTSLLKKEFAVFV